VSHHKTVRKNRQRLRRAEVLLFRLASAAERVDKKYSDDVDWTEWEDLRKAYRAAQSVVGK